MPARRGRCCRGKSLLPIGVTKVTGEFARGDAIAILDPEGREIARGLAGLDSERRRAGQGQEQRAGRRNARASSARTELVHRDNMVVLMGRRRRLMSAVEADATLPALMAEIGRKRACRRRGAGLCDAPSARTRR